MLNATITQEHKFKLYLSISGWHEVELRLCTAYTEYCKHQVQNHPMIDCLPRPASLSSLIYPHPMMWYSTLCIATSSSQPWIESEYLLCRFPDLLPPDHSPPSWPSPITSVIPSIAASKYSSLVTQFQTPTASANSLDHCLQGLTIMAPSASSFPVGGLQVYTAMATKYNCKLVPSWPPSGHDHCLQVHLQTH